MNIVRSLAAVFLLAAGLCGCGSSESTTGTYQPPAPENSGADKNPLPKGAGRIPPPGK